MPEPSETAPEVAKMARDLWHALPRVPEVEDVAALLQEHVLPARDAMVRTKVVGEIREHWREWQTARAENDGTRPAALRSSRAWYRLMVAIGEDLNDSQHAVAREMGWDQP